MGFVDDIKTIPVLPRLLLQGAAVAAILFTTPDNVRIVAACPLWIERGLLLLAGLWFVNLVNFMDGLDWMTVAEAVPITGAMVLLGWLGDFPAAATIVAAALCGAMLGFAPFNRPVAKVFLGDVGSLPIGLLLGWCLLQLAYSQHFAAALLLPLYYLADATVTLLRRMIRRRTVLGRASLAFLSARDRQRLYGVARGERGVRAQCRAGGIGDRISTPIAIGRRSRLLRAARSSVSLRRADDVPVFASRSRRRRALVRRRSSRIPAQRPSGRP